MDIKTCCKLWQGGEQRREVSIAIVSSPHRFPACCSIRGHIVWLNFNSHSKTAADISDSINQSHFLLADGACSLGSSRTRLGDGCTISDDCSTITCKMDFVDEPITFKLKVITLTSSLLTYFCHNNFESISIVTVERRSFVKYVVYTRFNFRKASPLTKSNLASGFASHRFIPNLEILVPLTKRNTFHFV